MKKLSLFIGLGILIIGFVPQATTAQETEIPKNFLVMEKFVSPADMIAFNHAQNKALEQLNKYNAGFIFLTYHTKEKH